MKPLSIALAGLLAMISSVWALPERGEVEGQSAYPSWSRAGKAIVYQSHRQGAWHLYVRDPGGTRRVTNGHGETNPTWSPDGRSIAYVSGDEPGRNVFVVPIGGGEPRQLTRDAGDNIHPHWAPDGSRILFNSSRDSLRSADPEIYELYTMRPDGADQRRLTRDGAVSTYADYSPDGKKIAFRRVVGGNSEIFVTAADGSGARNLTNHPSFDGWPAWSPDGKSIAFASDRSGTFQIYVMRADGSGLSRVVDSNIQATTPAWSSDGRTLSYTRTIEQVLSLPAPK